MPDSSIFDKPITATPVSHHCLCMLLILLWLEQGLNKLLISLRAWLGFAELLVL
jgi:hypothetical protein